MKKYLLLMLLPMVFGLASCDYHDKMIETGEMPTKATMFIYDYFPECEIVAIDKDRELGGISYDVVLNCGVKLEFDSKGEWTSVDCERSQVPDAIIPDRILDFVLAKYNNNYIVMIERDRYNYKIELNNDIELIFNKDGDFKRIED